MLTATALMLVFLRIVVWLRSLASLLAVTPRDAGAMRFRPPRSIGSNRPAGRERSPVPQAIRWRLRLRARASARGLPGPPNGAPMRYGPSGTLRAWPDAPRAAPAAPCRWQNASINF